MGSNPTSSAFARHSFSDGGIRFNSNSVDIDYTGCMVRASADKVRFYYVYVLDCKNKIPYIGCTDNLIERMKRHNNGYVPATKPLRPLTLKSYFAFSNKYTAFNLEKYLKSGSGRLFLKKHIFRQ